jgi:PAS domain S-box-containing protein
VDTRGKVALDRSGVPIGVIPSSHDITERKGYEATLELEREALRVSEAKYRSLVHAVPGVLYSCSVAHGGIYYSPQAGATVGYTAEALLAHPTLWHDSIHPDDVAAVDAAVEVGARSGTPIEVEYRIHAPSGEWRWLLDRSVRIAAGPDGDVIIDGLATDVTAHRVADESRRLQSAALDAAADAIVITDLHGCIEWINPAFTALTGYSAAEALGRHHRDLVRSDQQDPAFYTILWDTILDGRTWRGELINRHKDGSLYPLVEVITPICNSVGAITHFVAIQQDLTERRRLETHLRQTQRMESVGQLASGIAHDFNNLLTVINGVSDLLLEQVRADDPIRADIGEIRDAGTRAATLTRQLLAFSRQQILEPQVINLNTAITGMESLLQRLIGEDVALVIVPAPGLENVAADPGQIEQVVTNMVVNSRDAMPEGGKITIETQNVTIDETFVQQHDMEMHPGAYVLLAVTDSGVGMSEATRARIFEPFFTTKGPEQGTGLGLSTAYGIIKQSHGFIWVYSEPGIGTTFKIYLPQVADSVVAALRDTPTESVSGTETILLVEDNAGLRKLATRLLEPVGYTVLPAASAEEALQLLGLHEDQVHLLVSPVDLLLTDVVMPGMSGQKLAERLAATHPTMKVLYMSGYTDDTTVRHGVLQAQMAFLSKPFTRESLLRKVREVLDA